MKSWGCLVAAILLCLTGWGCASFRRAAVSDVVKQYLDLEMKGDVVEQQRLRALSTDAQLGLFLPTGTKEAGLDQWRLAKFEVSAKRVRLKGRRAEALVDALYNSVNPGWPSKSVTLTIYLQEEMQLDKKAWKVDELATRYEMLEKVVGKGNADLWMKQLRLQKGLSGR
jgi:hypothetical protein